MPQGQWHGATRRKSATKNTPAKPLRLTGADCQVPLFSGASRRESAASARFYVSLIKNTNREA